MFEWAKVVENVAKVRIKSITDSLFKYALFTLLIGVIASSLKCDSWVCIVLFVFGGLFVLTGIVFFCYFSFVNPDYLRSEIFQLKKQSIETLGDKDNSINPHIGKIIAITSPYNDQVGHSLNESNE